MFFYEFEERKYFLYKSISDNKFGIDAWFKSFEVLLGSWKFVGFYTVGLYDDHLWQKISAGDATLLHTFNDNFVKLNSTIAKSKSDRSDSFFFKKNLYDCINPFFGKKKKEKLKIIN